MLLYFIGCVLTIGDVNISSPINDSIHYSSEVIVSIDYNMVGLDTIMIEIHDSLFEYNKTHEYSFSTCNGGNVISKNSWYYNIFTNVGNSNFLSLDNEDIPASILVVGGGGRGGFSFGGGGGAGGVLFFETILNRSSNYSIKVGEMNSGNSAFSNITAYGGGSGGSYSSWVAVSGGSGGGNAGSGNSAAGGQGVSGQGNSGGSGSASTGSYGAGGGGGGSMSNGESGVRNSKGGKGGDGVCLSSWLNNISVGDNGCFGGGGGGGIDSYCTSGYPGNGGIGGGGKGCIGIGCNGDHGIDNSGGGGGGGSRGPSGGSSPGGNGGSGIVIVKYQLIRSGKINLPIKNLPSGKYFLTITTNASMSISSFSYRFEVAGITKNKNRCVARMIMFMVLFIIN